LLIPVRGDIVACQEDADAGSTVTAGISVQPFPPFLLLLGNTRL